jgi:trans-aconitate methyltransferase
MNQWNVDLYQNKHSYVWEYGAKILEILAPQPGERILDLGCGTGQLTAQIATTGASVVGLDSAKTAIAQARNNYPTIEFQLADGIDFSCDVPFDAVFSNAALHWIKPPEAVINCIWEVLKPGGRLVAEFGGKGNIRQITKALNLALSEPDYNPWYFPSIAEYSTLLEARGFAVTHARLFARPTQLEGEAGLANWLEMFSGDRLACQTSKTEIIKQIESQLRSQLYRDGHWFADYKRIQIVAIK